ncbi:MAG: EVE domain-containing protein [Alphaproteobacteria bacterium]|nr:EVE domain-containing protein [Alphaproteobacteria bacterium]
MQYWLIKTEPNTFSWQEQKQNGVEHWDGVRNYQARNYMKLMKIGDMVLFYHSGDERQVMGIVEVVKEFYPDTDENFVCVDVKTHSELKTPVSLKAIKNNHKLQEIPLVKQSRLSVMPLRKEDYEEILKMSQ